MLGLLPSGQFVRVCVNRRFEGALLLLLLSFDLLQEELALFARFASEQQVVFHLGEGALKLFGLLVDFRVECGLF